MRRRSRAVDRLLAQLGDESPEVRCAAIEGVERAQFGWDRRPRPSARQIDQVFRALTALLRRDPEPRVRHAAAYALTFWFQPRAPAALIAALEDAAEQPNIRGQAAEGIGNVLGAELGSPSLRARAIAELRRGLADPSPEVRFWCIYALGTMKASEARAEIERLAATDEAVCPYMWRVCHEAADVLTYWTEGEWPDRDFDPAAR
jgi:hypothetical protein